MAATIRVLAQLFPAAATQSTLYTCATTSAIISSLMICNTDNSTPDTVTVRISIGGAADNNKQLLFSGVTVMPNGTLDLTAGLTLASTDVIKVTSANGTSSFQLFGQENS